jgi:excisionase family DNA binding protein
MEQNTWLSPSEAARSLNISSEYIRKLCLQGKLAYVLTSLGRLIDPESVETFRASWLPRNRAGHTAVESNG